MSKKEDQQLTPTQAAHMLAHELGEMPSAWQMRLQNWRTPGRAGSLRHHQEPGRRPYYMASEVRAFVDMLQAARSQILGRSMHLAEATAINSGNAITVEWRGGGTDGRFHLNVQQAGQLGNKLVQLANSQIKATQEADNQG